METIKAYHTSVFNHTAAHTHFAPIPINILGESAHTLRGPVLTAAISEGIHAGVSTRDDLTLNIKMNLAGSEIEIEIDYNNIDAPAHTLYQRLVVAIIKKLQYEGYKVHKGLNISMRSSKNVPTKLGLHATFEMLVTHILSVHHHFNLSATDQVRYTFSAEMSTKELTPTIAQHFCVMFAKADHIMYLDTKTLKHTHIPLDKTKAFLHGVFVSRPKFIVNADIAKRIDAIESAARAIRNKRSIETLSDLTIKEFNSLKHLIPKKSTVPYSEHAMFEIERVEQALEYLKGEDFVMLGDVFEQSQHSLKSLYEVVAPYHSDTVKTMMHQGSLGARLSGMGHDQFTLGLFEPDTPLDFSELDSMLYKRYKKTLESVPIILENGIDAQEK